MAKVVCRAFSLAHDKKRGVCYSPEIKHTENIRTHDKLGFSHSAGSTHNASYTWKSLMYVKKHLISGVLWRVGNGMTIYVTRDPWIPGVLHQFAQPIIHTPDLKVNFLIDEENEQWKEDLV
jgi:hypothetical protein